MEADFLQHGKLNLLDIVRFKEHIQCAVITW